MFYKVKLLCAALLAVSVSAFAISGVVEIPDDATSLEWGTFRNRKDVVVVTIPYSVTSIDKSAFINCPNLTGVCFDDEDGWYITQDEECWQNKTMGSRFDATDSSTNAAAFRSGRYFFYKREVN